MSEEKLSQLQGIVSNVSRETFEKLLTYEALVQEWGRQFNLVASSTLGDVWERHILDSAQLFPLLKDPFLPCVDVGTGAGFPGMVLAILGCPDMTLVDATRKKCDFLEIVSRETSTPVHIEWARIETLQKKFDQVTVRAVAPLTELLPWVEGVLEPEGVAYILKGEKAHKEIEDAQGKWDFTYTLKESKTHDKGVIIETWDIRNKV